MNQQSLSALKGLDCRLWLVEAGVMTDLDLKIAHALKGYASSTIVVLNKIDKVKNKETLLPFMKQLSELGFNLLFPCCALKSDHLPRLLKEITPWVSKCCT